MKDQDAYLANPEQSDVENVSLIKPSSTNHPLYPTIVNACKEVFDPEIPVNIYDLGLIYTIEIDDEGQTLILMSLTAPGCPVAEEMPGWVSEAVSPVEGVKSVKVEIVWEPQWGMDMMSDEARLELGFM
ncbi:MAG: SUF system Fe-S cluster assembly protein [Paracoccaceae bacterium]|nr:SUF system Fe-S cluster assembly protein [Paracoccaceae bacterium]